MFNLKEELNRLKLRIETGRKALHEAAMKAEDLEAIIQGLRRTCESISQEAKSLCH